MVDNTLIHRKITKVSQHEKKIIYLKILNLAYSLKQIKSDKLQI
jgi:hypothetical protein